MIMSTCVDPKLLFHYSPNSAFDFTAAKRNCKNSIGQSCWTRTRTGDFWRLPFELLSKIVRIAAVGNRNERCLFRQNRGESDERHMDGDAQRI